MTLAALALGWWEAAAVAALRRALRIPDGAPNILLWRQLSGYSLRTEQGRRVCGLLLLGLFSGSVAAQPLHGILLFGWGWALWNVAYYGWLRLMVGWPRSLITLDFLTLIPRPWIGPVWLSLLVSAGLAAGCGIALLSTLR